MIQKESPTSFQDNAFYQLNILVSETSELESNENKKLTKTKAFIQQQQFMYNSELIDPMLRIGVFGQEKIISKLEGQQDKSYYWMESGHFIQQLKNAGELEQHSVEIQVVNRKNDRILGYLSLDLVSIYHQPNSSLINKRFNLLRNNQETNQQIVLSLNIAIQNQHQRILKQDSYEKGEFTAGSQEALSIQWKIIHLLKQTVSKRNFQARSFNQLLNNISQMYDQFSGQLQNIAQQFHQEISQSVEAQDELIVSFQFVSNYLLKQAQSYNQFAKNFGAEVEEPYHMVNTNYSLTNDTLFQNILEDQRKLEHKAFQIKKHQEGYYKISEQIEKTDLQIDKASHKVQKNHGQDEFKKLMNFQMDQKLRKAEEVEKYQFSIADYNNCWQLYEQKQKKYLEDLDLNYESRLSFTKQTMGRLIKSFDCLYTQENNQVRCQYESRLEQQKEEESISIVDRLQHEIKDVLPIKESHLFRERFQSYSQYQERVYQRVPFMQVSEQDDFTVCETLGIGSQRKINQKLQDIFYTTKVSYEDPSLIQQLFSHLNHIQYFLLLVKNEFKKSKVLGLTESQFNLCKEVFIIILDSLNEDMNTLDYSTLLDIIQICSGIYKKTDKRQTLYIANYLSHLQIWNNYQIWNSIHQEMLRREKDKAGVSRKTSKKGFLKQFFYKQVGNIQKNIQKNLLTQHSQQLNQQTTSLTEQTIDDQILDNINMFFIQLGLSIQLASGIIIKLIQKTNPLQTKQQIENSILHKLLQKQSNKRISDLRDIGHSSSLVRRRTKDYKNNLVILAKAMDYLSSQEAIGYAHLHSILLRKSHKIMLGYHNTPLAYDWLKANRFRLWTRILRAKEEDYTHLLNNLDTIANKNNDEIITLDVHRSFQIHPDKIPQDTLFRLLKGYAHLRPDVNYCQGMNYLMGYLYLQCLDENKTLNLFVRLVETHLDNVFTENLGQLKVLFYQFEKCLDIFLPDLAEHFKIERIDVQYFISPWLITIFGNVYQNTASSYLVMNIWDIFVQEGYKGLFKVCLSLLQTHQKLLLTFQFDEILNFLNELTKSPSFLIGDRIDNFMNHDDYEYVHKLKVEAQSFKITQQILHDLQNEYHNTTHKVNQMMQQINKL